MGIKGIYQEIGRGERIALAKLADDTLRRSGLPLRIAIDISIWLFQIQASEGGSSPEIRTLYYRIVRLLHYGIRAIFVFDGPNKPPFKRNAPTTKGPLNSNRIAKRLIKLLGFQCHDAPGEAEAECASLQKLGVVDAVLSEDVDTLAFGCTFSIRNWTSEGSKGNKAPTHVTVYDAAKIKEGSSKLDREGMILVALMSGGDYLPDGIPGCGTKVACEAARGGFGHDLCELNPDIGQEFIEWKERLCYELAENESGYFKTRHKALALKVPPTFPDREVLNYHANPVVSSDENLLQLNEQLRFYAPVDIKGLRDFVDEAFNWKHRSGAKKFLRQIAPALLAHKLRMQAIQSDGSRNMEEQQEREERLLLTILNRRTAFDMGSSELKVVYIPALIADFDIDQEIEEQPESSARLSSDEEVEARPHSEQPQEEIILGPVEDTAEPIPPTNDAKRKSRLAEWDPNIPQKAWLLESAVSLGAPLSLERWDAELKAAAEKQSRDRGPTRSGGMKQGVLEAYLKVVKPNSLSVSKKETLESQSEPSSQRSLTVEAPKQVTGTTMASNNYRPAKALSSKAKKSTKSGSKANKALAKRQVQMPSQPKDRDTNPWTLAQRKKYNSVVSHSTSERLGRDESRTDFAVVEGLDGEAPRCEEEELRAERPLPVGNATEMILE